MKKTDGKYLRGRSKTVAKKQNKSKSEMSDLEKVAYPAALAVLSDFITSTSNITVDNYFLVGMQAIFVIGLPLVARLSR